MTTCMCRVLIWQVSGGSSTFPFSHPPHVEDHNRCSPDACLGSLNRTGNNGCLREESLEPGVRVKHILTYSLKCFTICTSCLYKIKREKSSHNNKDGSL